MPLAQDAVAAAPCYHSGSDQPKYERYSQRHDGGEAEAVDEVGLARPTVALEDLVVPGGSEVKLAREATSCRAVVR